MRNRAVTGFQVRAIMAHVAVLAPIMSTVTWPSMAVSGAILESGPTRPSKRPIVKIYTVLDLVRQLFVASLKKKGRLHQISALIARMSTGIGGSRPISLTRLQKKRLLAQVIIPFAIMGTPARCGRSDF